MGETNPGIQSKRSRLGQTATRPWHHAVFGLFGIILLAGFAFFIKPIHPGDSLEYVYTLQAWSDHGTPDLRAEDVEKLAPLLRANQISLPDPFGFFIRSKDGRFYSQHFWLYSLLALPAKAILRIVSANELAAFQVTNAFIFLVALYTALFRNRSSIHQRLVLTGFAGVSPVLWYLCWMHPEAATWAFVLISLVHLGHRRFLQGSVWASLGAMQNPPVIFLTGLMVLLSFGEKKIRTGIAAGAAGLLSFVPVLFSYVVFGTANPIIAKGAADYNFISWGRTWSFLTDFNQGILPYAPLLLALAAAAVLRIALTLNRTGLATCGTLAAMIVTSEMTANWNSGCAGMMRYAVWTLPIFAWLVAEYLPFNRLLGITAIAGIAIQALVLIAGDRSDAGGTQQPLAAFILDHAPYLYHPDPEIFAERQLGADLDYGQWLPIAYISRDGSVRKLLIDSKSLAQLPDIFRVEGIYFERIRNQYERHKGLFFLTPPSGAIVDPRHGAPPPTTKETRQSVRLRILEFPSHVEAPNLTVVIAMTNQGTATFSHRRTGMHYPLTISYRVLAQHDFQLCEHRQPALTGDFGSGQTATVGIPISLPPEGGSYVIEFAPGLIKPAWGGQPRLFVTVGHAPNSAFSARISTRRNQEARFEWK